MADRPYRTKGGIKEILCHNLLYNYSNATVAMDSSARYNRKRPIPNLFYRLAQKLPDLCPTDAIRQTMTQKRSFLCQLTDFILSL